MHVCGVEYMGNLGPFLSLLCEPKIAPQKSVKKQSQGSVAEHTAQPMFTGLTYFKTE